MSHGDHLSKQYDTELEQLRTRVLQMGGLVEAQVRAAVEAYSSGNIETVDALIENDKRVNGFEVSIDNTCSQVIARRQPAASDLRLILGITKIVTDLERIGDEAEKIARMAKRIYESDRGPLPSFADVRYPANIALDMLRRSLDALARLDPSESAHVIRQDEEIDAEFRSMLRELITYMMEDPRTISTVIDVIWIAKAIERIGDHAKNMAEFVIYIVKGADVRHVTMDELEREALG